MRCAYGLAKRVAHSSWFRAAFDQVNTAMDTKLSRHLLLDNARADKTLRQVREMEHARHEASIPRVSSKHRRSTPALAGFSSTYADYLPINQAWNAYIATVASSGAPNRRAMRLAQADLHGAVATVVSAHRPHLVGLCGIIVRATPHVVHVVTPRNKLQGACGTRRVWPCSPC